MVSEVPANVWQAIRDLQDKMSQKAMERDLEDILELIHDDLGSKPNQGVGVQFQTPVRSNPEATYMKSMGSAPSGRDMMSSESSRNQDLHLLACGASFAPMHLQEEIGTLRKLLNKLRDKVYKYGKVDRAHVPSQKQ